MRLHINERLQSKTTYSPPVDGQTSGCSALRSGSIKDFEEKINGEEYILRGSDYSVHLANSPELRRKASALIQRMYSWRGYTVENDSTPHKPNRLTLVAFNDAKLIGTVTLGLDSEDGLLADKLYSQEINDFRLKGGKVCELSRFALDPQSSSKEVIAVLFQLAYIYAHNVCKATDLFGEVNPRHAGFHKRMFGFRQIGETRVCPRVGAPAVLLHLKLCDVEKKLSFLAGSNDANERSLYRYCVSQQERVESNTATHIKCMSIEKYLPQRGAGRVQ